LQVNKFAVAERIWAINVKPEEAAVGVEGGEVSIEKRGCAVGHGDDEGVDGPGVPSRVGRCGGGTGGRILIDS
jgi:hypothetical protein